MAGPPPDRRATIAPDDWIGAAERSLGDAEILFDAGGSPESTYELAGFAVECALKALIMRRRGWTRWPDRRREPRLHSHNLGRLLELADLKAALEQEAGRSRGLIASWRIVHGWDHDLRYPGAAAMPRRTADDMLRAVNHPEHGVLPWLMRHYSRP